MDEQLQDGKFYIENNMEDFVKTLQLLKNPRSRNTKIQKNYRLRDFYKKSRLLLLEITVHCKYIYTAQASARLTVVVVTFYNTEFTGKFQPIKFVTKIFLTS